MPTPADLVSAALTRWRNNLIDLTRRNPLLNLKPNHTSYLEIVQPDLMRVDEHLRIQDKSWLFHLPPETPKSDKQNDAPKPAPRGNELVTTEADRQTVLKILTNLYRRALADFRERGLHILYVALGVLEWRDDEDETFRSPILLLPVKLDRHSLKDPFQLSAIDEDMIVNPALGPRLKQDFDFKLPLPPEDWESKKPNEYLDEVKAAIAGLPGWDVRPSVILTWFSFFKGVIFQDLQDHAPYLQVHSLVQSLAGTPMAPQAPRGKGAQDHGEMGLDARQDPQQTFHILDADGSQRLCLEAAARGESFVLIGPPGTGKSQTIANLIADQIAHGKKVLFVSEKMAALEVVYKRLCHVGLSEFCLELHSHKANKREVIKELARCYEEKLPPQAVSGVDDFARLRERREKLNRYMQALHQLREPLKKSVWDALAEMPRWQNVQMIPLADGASSLALTEFTSAQVEELQQLLQRLQHHWHIRTDANYPWRGFKAERYTLQLRDEVVSLIDKIRSRGDKLRVASQQYARTLDITGSIADLLKIGDLLEKRPPQTMASWLTMPDIAAFLADFEECADRYQRLSQSRKPLTERYGPALWNLAPGSAGAIDHAWKEATAQLGPGDERGAEFLKQHHKLRAWTAETQKRVPGWLVELRTLEKWLQVPLALGVGSTSAASCGDKLDPSIGAVRAFIRLASFALGDAPPEKSWLDVRQTAESAFAIATSSKEAFLRYKKNRAHLLKTYSDKLFDLDLGRIGQAYQSRYRSWLCVFSWQYRKDRRAIAKCRPMEDIPATVAEDMQVGAQFHADRARLQAEQPERTRLLGRYDKGLDTDIEAAERAARHAVEAHSLAREMDCERLPARTIEALAAGSAPEKIRAAFKRLNESFVAWSHLTTELQAILPIDHVASAGAALDDCSLSALAQYAKNLQVALNQFGGLADPLMAPALREGSAAREASRPSTPADIADFITDLKQAEEMLVWEKAQATEAERWSRELGALFQGVSTDWDAVRRGIQWSMRLRDHIGNMGQAFSDALERAATEAPPSSRELRNTVAAYEAELHHLEVRFEAPGPRHDGKPLREHTPETVLELLGKWRERVGELADWIDWRFLPERFAHMGLKSFWDRLQQTDVRREQVVELFLKSFWSAWLDAMFQADPTLNQYRRDEQERAVVEFRDLDRRILQQGAGRITTILDPAQSARASDREIALLMKEAHKKTKHLPLRQLFAAMPTLLLQLKPCILMSPLSVSQFLPADSDAFHFDLVIFDEASQILPEDAVGAIYRGKQLIVTGDNQQLPPTTFFQQAIDGESAEEDEPLFESILDACLGAGWPQRMLRWHYRSQDERLIAFSNETYYDGRLFTFPSPLVASAAAKTAGGAEPVMAEREKPMGIHLHHVQHGVYDRGGRRDNPREAEAVATLVLEHFRNTADKTLGVIAFSYAQMNAIEDEIERRLREHADLEQFFKDDRLEGFFVKNLETVQGDERDVILLSVGYGRDAQGKIELNFGPLNREGGERRLNVAITRARQRLIVVSSILAADLKLGEGHARGLAHLQRYLDFAEHGLQALQPDGDASAMPSSLHDDVMRELASLGFEGQPLVGCGQCRLDIGVRDGGDKNRFIMGIEFDGPMLSQIATARDRERLRHEVLARLGWRLHRIAASDWVYRREQEIERLRAALAQ